MNSKKKLKVTKHAKLRLKQRCGIKKRGARQAVKRVLQNGIPHSQTTGRLNKWMTGLYFRSKGANNILLYGDKVYIFRNKVLITVFPIPDDLCQDMKNMIKECIA